MSLFEFMEIENQQTISLILKEMSAILVEHENRIKELEKCKLKVKP